MALRKSRTQIGYGFTNALQKIPPRPLAFRRAPATNDRGERGQIWIDLVGNDAYILLNTVSNTSSWISIGAGNPILDSLVVNPGNATITAGNFEVTAGTVTIGAFAAEGVVLNSAAGLLSTVAGNDGQVVIGSTGALPVFATIASSDATVIFTPGAGTLDLSVQSVFGFATASAGGGAVTATNNAKVGYCTFAGTTTASGAQETFTITNSEVSATSAILVTVSNLGANDSRMSLEQVKPAAGTFEVMTQNNGAAATSGDVYIMFMVLS